MLWQFAIHWKCNWYWNDLNCNCNSNNSINPDENSESQDEFLIGAVEQSLIYDPRFPHYSDASDLTKYGFLALYFLWRHSKWLSAFLCFSKATLHITCILLSLLLFPKSTNWFVCGTGINMPFRLSNVANRSSVVWFLHYPTVSPCQGFPFYRLCIAGFLKPGS